MIRKWRIVLTLYLPLTPDPVAVGPAVQMLLFTKNILFWADWFAVHSHDAVKVGRLCSHMREWESSFIFILKAFHFCGVVSGVDPVAWRNKSIDVSVYGCHCGRDSTSHRLGSTVSLYTAHAGTDDSFTLSKQTLAWRGAEGVPFLGYLLALRGAWHLRSRVSRFCFLIRILSRCGRGFWIIFLHCDH